MAYVAPNSTLRLLHNVPLDITYENTIYFASASAQSAYFAGLAKYTQAQYTYLRKENVIRVNLLADNLYDVNYIMFQNTSFGSKWFYAFVTNVEYINNETSEISFVIDVMQTWAFDYTLNPCWIERQHTITDDIGQNLVPENLELGDYVCRNFDGSGHLGNLVVVAACTFDTNMDDVAGGEYGGVYSGLTYNVFDNADDFNQFITDATEANKETGIVSIFMMPEDFVREEGQSVATFDITKSKNLTDIDGYEPKNNKLFTYPYNFMYVTNLDGNAAEFHYEYFSGNKCTFGLAGDMTCNPCIVLYPQDYKGIPANYNEKMTISHYPQCAYNIDAFKAYLAQVSNIVDLFLPIAQGAGQGAMTSIAAGNLSPQGVAGGALLGSGVAIAQSVAKLYDHYTLPPQSRGQQAGTTLAALAIKDFAFIQMTIRAEFAKIIDDYWTKYGYPIKRISVPNLIARPHWTYIQTIGSDLTGSIPAQDMAMIKQIFDKGITFWRNGSEVGNYNLDNSPNY